MPHFYRFTFIHVFFNTVATGLLDIDSSKISCTSLCFKSETKKGRHKKSSNFSAANLQALRPLRLESETDGSLFFGGKKVAYNGPQLARTISGI